MKGPGRTITYKPIEWASLIKPLKEKERWRRFVVFGSQHNARVNDFKLIQLIRDFLSLINKWKIIRVRSHKKLLLKNLHHWQRKKAYSYFDVGSHEPCNTMHATLSSVLSAVPRWWAERTPRLADSYPGDKDVHLRTVIITPRCWR